MSWFGEIVNEAFNRQWKEREKNAGEITKYIPHDGTAFRPGDEIFYTFNSGKGGVVYVYGTVISNNDGKTVTFTTNRSKGRDVTTRNIFNPDGSVNRQLFHCRSWLKPVEDSGNIAFTEESYYVSYETAKNLTVRLNKEDVSIPDGTELIVINEKTKGYKKYYTWPDGEYLGKINTSRENLGNVIYLPKIGETEPTRVNKKAYDKSTYVSIPPQAMLIDSDGKFYAWNYKYRGAILKCCPWLKEKPANWAESIDGKVYTIIPKQ